MNKRRAESSSATTKKPRREAFADDEIDNDENFEEMMTEDEERTDLDDADMAESDEFEAINTATSSQSEPLRNFWYRPTPPPIDPTTFRIAFQELDADYYIGEQQPGYPGVSEGQVPIIRMFGATAEGYSVCAHVRGYTPYIYIQAPPNFDPSKCDEFKRFINKRLEHTRRDAKANSEYVVLVEPVEKTSLMNYQFGAVRTFLKIYTAIPGYVKPLRALLEQGFEIPGLGYRKFLTYESNILFVLRCMIDSDIIGGGWIEVPAGKYNLRNKDKKESHAQIEIDVSYEELIPHAPEGEWLKNAPVRILSFDIECAGRKGHFPEAEHDPVIQIANYVTILGEKKPIIKNVFVLDKCANIVGADVLDFENEKDLLIHWRNFMSAADPDIITGYNICNFDLPYLLNRAKALNLNRFWFLGRMKNSKCKMRNAVFSSKAYGTRESKEITIEGRVQLDVLQAVQRDYKLSSYSLNSVSAHFLGEQKEDVHHSIITDLQNGDAETRRRLAIYCLKDAYLPQRLLDKLMIISNYVEMARVTGVPVSFLLARGQQIKVLSQLLRKAKTKNLLMPTPPEKGPSTEKYEGATVIEPMRGFYQKPIATLDFASLYPSIMMAHNLCYTTLLHKNDIAKLNPDQYVQTPSGDYFVKSDVSKGVLPIILEELIAARKKARAELAVETDPLRKAVLDGRQLALKISANSVYGFTGATTGMLPCLPISQSITAYGRVMINFTKEKVEEKYKMSNGYKHDAVVIYGDTDSVMVKFGPDDLAECMELGREAAEHVSKFFTKPIKLEFEKVYFPYLLINKKRYAGLLWTKPEKYDKMDAKGIETVRRDNCSLVRNVINTVLHKILIQRSIEEAVRYVKATISDLLRNRMDISMLIISKALSKHGEDYESKQAHAELAKRMRARDPATAPSIGDRVPYVIIKAAKGAKTHEKSEDPIYVLENNIPIDTQYYLEHQLAQPLLRIFEPIIDKPQSLLFGEHTRSISVPTPKTGGIMKFAQKTLTCLRCKALLPKGDESAVCVDCQPYEADVYQKLTSQRNHFDHLFSRVWTQCQRCQGSLHQDVICTSRDCPIFYMRKKVQKELKDVQDQIDRFETISW